MTDGSDAEGASNDEGGGKEGRKEGRKGGAAYLAVKSHFLNKPINSAAATAVFLR